MRVGFLENHLSPGGTTVALFDYAHYNEELLKNTSFIVTRVSKSLPSILQKFTTRFGKVYNIDDNALQDSIDDLVQDLKLDVLYVMKSGAQDGYCTTKCKCVIHCVFDTTDKHGDIHAAIHEELNARLRTTIPVVPHMVTVSNHTFNFKETLAIPQDAIVLGQHGSYNAFDIPFAQQAVIHSLSIRPDIYFVFLNTREFVKHPRVHFLPYSYEADVKRAFINTVDAMLHARIAGETFGLAPAEMSLCGKPVITWASSKIQGHFSVLGDACIKYSSYSELLQILLHDMWKSVDVSKSNVQRYTPETVMRIFNDVFLK